MGQRYQLDNGLTVVFAEQHTAQVAAFQVWVDAGSADERPDQSGLAHLHEHMLFKGTSRRASGEIAREVEARGGEINAWTSFDNTVYHVVLASQFARVGLEVLSEAIRDSAFQPDELAREIEVVCEEIKRSEDLPGRRASRDLFATAYRVHPYGRPVIGSEETVRTFTRERVLEFYRTYYSPRNMILAAVGDFREADLRQWSDELFGGEWGRPFAGANPRTPEPPRLEPRIHFRPDEAKEAYLNLAMAIPSLSHEDAPALDLLAVLLGQGEASRLVLELKRRRGLVNDIRVYSYTPEDPGLMVVSMVLPPTRAAEALEAAARQIAEFGVSLSDDSALASAKALLEADAVYQRESVQGVARNLGFYQSAAGGIERESEYYEKISAVSAAQLRRTVDRYFRLEKAVLSGLLPTGADLNEERAREILDRVSSSPRPAREEPKPSAIQAPLRVTGAIAARATQPGVHVERLDSGATIVVREESSAPLFAVRAVFLGGLRYETEETNGLTSLLARTITRGTTGLDSEQIARLVQSLSGSVGGQAGRNSTGLRAEFLSRHFDRGMTVFADSLLNPTFAEGEVERERALLLEDILAREDNPGAVAQDLFARTLYERHPYRMNPSGERASVEKLTPEVLREYHGRYMDPSQLTLCVVGDVKTDLVLRFAQDAFGKRGPRAAPLPQVPVEPGLPAFKTAKRVLPRAQAHVLLGFRAARVNEPWRYPLELLSSVLSGQGGRLFLELRDKRSMAYSVGSFAVEGLDPGFFAVYIATSPPKVDSAIEAIRAELTRARDEKISDPELRRAQQYLIGSHEIGLQRNNARAALLGIDHCYGLGAENFLRYAEKVLSVTAEEVQEVARRVIDFGRGALVMVGP
jgi:zinc protease